MDLIACAVVSTAEVLAAQKWSAAPGFVNTFLIFFTLQYLTVKYYRIFLYPLYFSPLRHLPGPTDNQFFFGQALNLIKAETPTTLYIKWMREHPDVPLIRFLTFGNGEVVVCNSPDSFRDVLQTKCYSFRKSDFFRRLTKEIVGHGLVTMEGEAHKAHRKMVNPVFSINNIRRLEPVFQKKAQEVTLLFDRALDAGGGKTATIDCTATFTKATLDVMGVALFGVDLSGLSSTEFSTGDGRKDRQSAGAKSDGRQMTFHEAYDGIFGQDTLGKILMFANAFVPVRWLPLEANRKYLFATKWLADVLTQLVRERTKDVRGAHASGKYVQGEARDLLTFIVEESLPGGPAEAITEEEIVGDLLQLMAAGHDTSANILSWTVYIMATRQELQDRLREEMLRELGHETDLAYSQIEALPFLDSFLRETLRVYASATTTHRQTVKDETICGIFIPKDTTFDIVPHVTLMNPLIWGEDVDEFKPDRWENLSEEARSPYAFSTFSNGPRVCLGRSFAFREMKIILVAMVRGYRFLKVDGPFTVENPSLILRPRGLRVVLEKSSLVISILVVSSRYNKSAAFERPFQLTILTLFVCGGALTFLPRFFQGTPPYDGHDGHDGHDSITSEFAPPPSGFPPALGSLLRYSPSTTFSFSCSSSSSSTSTLGYILVGIVVRTILFWRTVRTIHCSWDGVETLLPFFLAIFALLSRSPPAILLPARAHETRPQSTRPPSHLVKYAAVALIWGLAAIEVMYLSERGTGVICPPAWYAESMIPVAQLIGVACDAWVLMQVGALCQDAGGPVSEQPWRFCGITCLASAIGLSFLSLGSCIDRTNIVWNFILDSMAVRDFFLDGVLLTTGVISGLYLLEFAHPTTIGTLVAATSAFAQIQGKVLDGTMVGLWSHWWGLSMVAVVFLAPGLLQQMGVGATSDTDRSRPRLRGLFYRSRHVLYAVLILAFVGCEVILLSPAPSAPVTPAARIASARVESDAWIASAKQSTSLEAAVIQYRRRYGIPPPPNFDKWYAFATEAQSPIIDTFDQIHADLLPFWGLSPTAVRSRTAHLLEHPGLWVGGLAIRDGHVEISPHVAGTHRWMMDVVQAMIEPFAQWLPDMQLAFNLDDESRIAVPHAEMSALVQEGLASRSRLGAWDKQLSPFTKTLNPPWSDAYLDLGEGALEKMSPLFKTRRLTASFYEWIQPTCPAEAPARRHRWWNKGTRCAACSAPHMDGGFVSDWELSGDLCHQPDMAHLHGFLTSPNALTPSHALLPVFSQGRVHRFADILYPSPWNYGDKVGSAVGEGEASIPWQDKSNSVYWRGALSDGFSEYGAWQTFLRARMVALLTGTGRSVRRGIDILANPTGRPTTAHTLASRSTISATPPDTASDSSDPDLGVAVNVSFVGDFERCSARDRGAARATFYGGASAPAPEALNFAEHWRHRHLVDVDGAGFSGRFPSFLASGSLPYRAALFRTWWEERVHPWRHFVPLDARLAELRGVLRFFGGDGESGSSGDDGDIRNGPDHAEEMARAGREWAAQALRKDDMRVYMFRLLLEWGRVVDDDREVLGFEL